MVERTGLQRTNSGTYERTVTFKNFSYFNPIYQSEYDEDGKSDHLQEKEQEQDSSSLKKYGQYICLKLSLFPFPKCGPKRRNVNVIPDL